MNATRCFVLMFAAFVTIVLGQNRTERPRTIVETTRARLTVEVLSASFKVGSPLLLRVQFKNISGAPIHLTDSGPSDNYHVKVMDATGKEMTKTDRGESIQMGRDGTTKEIVTASGKKVVLSGGGPLKMQRIDLAPGAVWTDTLDVAEIYALTVPGSYIGQLFMTIPDWDERSAKDPLVLLKDERAIANGFTITITQ
ncbi:MAG: hypothetical protein ABI824_08745 [Acidobacteriota bacterium]